MHPKDQVATSPEGKKPVLTPVTTCIAGACFMRPAPMNILRARNLVSSCCLQLQRLLFKAILGSSMHQSVPHNITVEKAKIESLA